MPLQSRRANRTYRRPPQALQRPPVAASWRPHHQAPPDPALRPPTLGHYRLRPTRAAAVRHRGRPDFWCRSPARWAASRATKHTTPRQDVIVRRAPTACVRPALWGESRSERSHSRCAVGGGSRSISSSASSCRTTVREKVAPSRKMVTSHPLPRRAPATRLCLDHQRGRQEANRSMSPSDERSTRTQQSGPPAIRWTSEASRPKRTPAIWPQEVLAAVADTHLADRRHHAHLLRRQVHRDSRPASGTSARLSCKRSEGNEWDGGPVGEKRRKRDG